MSAARRLLLVEDDALDRAAVLRALRGTGSAVEQASTLEQARAALLKMTGTFDCVLIDLGLPDGDGCELLTMLTELPAIILTGHDAEEEVQRALALGAQDYLLKDELDERGLIRAIRYAIERKQAERLRHGLARADRLVSLGELAVSVAHEVNNPNAFVQANLEHLREELSAWRGAFAAAALDSARLDEAIGLIDESREGVQRVTTIVRQLLGFARAGEEEPEAVDLNEVVRWSIGLVENQLRHRARLEVRLGDLPSFFGRRGPLAQVVTNLLVNAVQSLPEGNASAHHILVETSLSSDELLIVVEDTGRGISAEIRGRVFEPFFTTKARGEGTGLGLSIVTHVVSEHGGSVSLEPGRDGRGTRAEVRLPRSRAVARAEVAPSPPEREERAPRLRLLLIDDEPLLLRAFRRLFSAHSVETAASGQEALELIELDDAFDGILCDLMMPDVDGAELHRRLLLTHPALAERMVFYSGGAFTSGAQEFVAALENPVLEKPVSANDITRALAYWQARRS